MSSSTCCSSGCCESVYLSASIDPKVCCSALQCVAVCCSALQCVAVRCSALHGVAVRCMVLQCVAWCCSALQCVAVRESLEFLQLRVVAVAGFATVCTWALPLMIKCVTRLTK